MITLGWRSGGVSDPCQKRSAKPLSGELMVLFASQMTSVKKVIEIREAINFRNED